MPVIKPVLHHVTFKTSRLDEMMAWYRTVLGGTINFKDDHNGWMTNDEANHRFAFLSVPGLEDVISGLATVSTLLRIPEDRRSRYEKRGVWVRSTIAHKGGIYVPIIFKELKDGTGSATVAFLAYWRHESATPIDNRLIVQAARDFASCWLANLRRIA